MKLHISLITLSSAAMLFAVPAYAVSQAPQTNAASGCTSLYVPAASKTLKRQTTLPLGFKGRGRTRVTGGTTVLGVEPTGGTASCSTCGTRLMVRFHTVPQVRVISGLNQVNVRIPSGR